MGNLHHPFSVKIHHGTTPASMQGTNTKKMAVPVTEAVPRRHGMATIADQ
jgi:hypothetical protein